MIRQSKKYRKKVVVYWVTQGLLLHGFAFGICDYTFEIIPYGKFILDDLYPNVREFRVLSGMAGMICGLLFLLRMWFEPSRIMTGQR
jgi:hypothetical protein